MHGEPHVHHPMNPAHLLLGGMLALAVALGLGRFAFTPILPAMQEQFGLDARSAGWLAASNNVGYLIGALWAGWVRGDDARHRLLAWGFASLVASLVLMAATQSMALWIIWRLVAGIASAWVFVLASALVVPLLTGSGHGRWSGFHFGGVGLGIVLAGSVIGWTVNTSGSAIAWQVTGLFALVLSLVSWRILRRAHAGVAAAAAARPATPVRFPMPLLAAAYFCQGLGYIVTGTFLVAVVRATPGLEDYANLSWILVGLAALPSTAAWSFLAERKGHVPVLILSHAIQAVGIALPALFHQPVAVLAGAVLYGGTFLGVVGMSLAFGRAITPGNPARTMGLLTAVFGIGQIAGPVLAAWLAGRGGWDWALLAAAAIILAGVPLLVLGERWSRLRLHSLTTMT